MALPRKRAAELLGGLYAEAAVDRAAEDQGQGFSVSVRPGGIGPWGGAWGAWG